MLRRGGVGVTIAVERWSLVFFFQAEDGIRDAQESRGLGDVYKRQVQGGHAGGNLGVDNRMWGVQDYPDWQATLAKLYDCLLYTSDAADDLLCVDLGGRRIIKKKTIDNTHHTTTQIP